MFGCASWTAGERRHRRLTGHGARRRHAQTNPGRPDRAAGRVSMPLGMERRVWLAPAKCCHGSAARGGTRNIAPFRLLRVRRASTSAA